MCGRYTLAGSLDEIAAYFAAKTGQIGEDGSPLWDWEPNYNIAPGTVVPVIAYDGRKERKVVPLGDRANETPPSPHARAPPEKPME